VSTETHAPAGLNLDDKG